MIKTNVKSVLMRLHGFDLKMYEYKTRPLRACATLARVRRPLRACGVSVLDAYAANDGEWRVVA